jgi:hypothetical protein
MSMLEKKTTSPWMLGVTFVAVYLVNFFLGWPTTRWGDITTGFFFGDFKALFIWSNECRIDASLPHLVSIYSQIEASDTCSGFNYGTTLLILLSIFPIDIEFYVAAALTIGIFAVFTLGYFLQRTYKMSFRQKLIVTLAFFSPGTFLLFERGNLDVVIFLLVVIAAAIFARGVYIPAYLLLVFATLLKFYVLPAVIIAALFAKTVRQKTVVTVLTIVTITWVVFDFSRGSILSVYGPVQFGYPVLQHYFEWLELSLGPLPSLIGFLTPLAVWALLVLVERKAGTRYQTGLSQTISALRGDYAFIFAAITFCGMFFVGLSFDYRLIFLALAGVGLLLRSAIGRKLKIVLWFSLIIALWGSGAIGGNFLFIPAAIKPILIGGFQLAGDLAVFMWVGILLHVGALVVANKIEWVGRFLAFVTRSENSFERAQSSTP